MTNTSRCGTAEVIFWVISGVLLIVLIVIGIVELCQKNGSSERKVEYKETINYSAPAGARAQRAAASSNLTASDSEGFSVEDGTQLLTARAKKAHLADTFLRQKIVQKKEKTVSDPYVEKVLLDDFQNTGGLEADGQFESLTVDTSNLKNFHSTLKSNDEMFSSTTGISGHTAANARNIGINPNQYMRPPLKRRVNVGTNEIYWGMTESMHQTLMNGGVHTTPGCVSEDEWKAGS